MLFKSALVTQASGSIGGMTLAHNAGGMYIRARAIPVDPGSTNQLGVRNALTTLTNAWTEQLSLAERNSWNLYASNVPITNPLGDTVNISGQNWFIAANTPRLQANAKLATTALARVDTATPIFNRGTLTAPTVIGDTGDTIIAFNNTDTWATTTGGALLVFQGKPVNAARNYFRGPFRLVARILGAATPPTSPATIAVAAMPSSYYAFYDTPNAYFYRFVATTVDGRLSTGQIVRATLI